MTRTVALLGSTGSIGTQALDVVDTARVSASADGVDAPFEVVALAAGGGRPDLLAEQVVAHDVSLVGLADGDPHRLREAVRAAAAALGRREPDVEILVGAEAATQVAGRGADVVLNGITGSIGLRPTLAALHAGSTLALANKESLIAGGPLVRAAQRRPDQVVPVDSEHSAIAQALRAGTAAEVARIVLTASGGPFRGRTRADLADVTPDQALAHPTWAMGPVVTTNSATLVNKGLELIEAHLLFDVPVDDIAVVVHPQSVIHSMVEFIDGSTIAQASPPDMRLPIALGLGWPDRVPGATRPCRWDEAASWTFEPVDDVTFPALDLARSAVTASATHPAVYNAANEVCVEAFLGGRIAFLDIVDTLARVVDEHDGTAAPDVDLEVVDRVEGWARRRAADLIAR